LWDRVVRGGKCSREAYVAWGDFMKSLPPWLLAVCLGAAAGICSVVEASEILDKVPPFRIAHVESGYEVAAQLHEGRDVLNLQAVPRSGAGVAPMPMTKRVQLWRPLLEQLFRERGRKREYVLTVQGYVELNTRMAAAAATSQIWDADAGAPKSGGLGRAVLEILNTGPLYPELVTLFEPLGYQVAAVHADNILVGRRSDIAREIAPAPSDVATLTPNAKLPYGASIVFRLTVKGSK
jgi:hypothetical protein